MNRLLNDKDSFEKVNWEIGPDFIYRKGKSFELKTDIDQLYKVLM
jgi:hypothetical protein